NDVLLLAQSFLERSKANAGGRILGLTSGAAQRLLAYTWPGNVRELQNCIERAMALSQFDHIGVDDLPERISRVQPTRLEVEIADVTEFLPMDEIERRYVAQVLAALGGNKASAARALGMDRRTLYRKLDAWASGKRATESELPPEGKDVA
ncbi:MAG TPA: helix-turn-helix domain-containing protein, partial [Polyangiaceae bacterium]